jgi:hypothetical protein
LEKVNGHLTLRVIMTAICSVSLRTKIIERLTGSKPVIPHAPPEETIHPTELLERSFRPTLFGDDGSDFPPHGLCVGSFASKVVQDVDK